MREAIRQKHKELWKNHSAHISILMRGIFVENKTVIIKIQINKLGNQHPIAFDNDIKIIFKSYMDR